MMLAMGTVLFLSSCGGDSDPVIDTGDGTILVADGLYIAQVDVDPVSAGVLNVENVEVGFDSEARENYFANYVYLTAGNYNIVNVIDKEITETFGGTATAETFENENCEVFNYTLVASTIDGSAFSVAANGLYKVTFDKSTNEIILGNVSKAGLIGDATSIGWSASQTVDLAGSVTATSGSWTASDITLRKGAFKLRMNCNWKIDRRIDTDLDGGVDDAGNDNGYILFTNFGADATAPVSGTSVNLVPGNDGANIAVDAVGGVFPDEAVYTVTVTWTPDDGFAMELNRTGEAVVIDFNPSEHQWALVGEATTLGAWPSNNDCGAADQDVDMNYEGESGGTHTWLITTDLSVSSFKFRTNDCWDNNKGFNDITNSGDLGELSADGDGNYAVAVAGNYTITLTTSDGGDSYSADFKKN